MATSQVLLRQAVDAIIFFVIELRMRCAVDHYDATSGCSRQIGLSRVCRVTMLDVQYGASESAVVCVASRSVLDVCMPMCEASVKLKVKRTRFN